MHIVGFDVGGTKIECAVLKVVPGQSGGDLQFTLSDKQEASGSILARKRTPTDRHKGYEHVLSKMKELFFNTCREAGVAVKEIHSVGIGLPGSIDPLTEKMINGNTIIFKDKDLKADFAREIDLNINIHIENDANCFALAEAQSGAGRLYKNEHNKSFEEAVGIGIILGTGVGGGIIVRGRILGGHGGGGGEIGHFQIVTDGKTCFCGRPGCAEQYLSGSAVEGAFATRNPSAVGKRLKSHEIFELARKEDPVAMTIINQYKKYISRFITNLCNIFDPDYFVFGGGVSCQAVIYEGLAESVAGKRFLRGVKPTIYQHQLGDSAGVVGAALLAI